MSDRMGGVADLSTAFDVPGEQTYDRRLDQTWPGKLAQEAWSAVQAPGRALQSTEPITSEQMIKPAADLAGLVTGGSYARPAMKDASGMGIRAYHSSPHDITPAPGHPLGKFDLSKIGTGEGAQAYGHGLYFAENPAVSGQGGQYWNQFTKKFEGPEYLAADKLKKAGFDREAAIALAQKDHDAVAEAFKYGTHPPGLVGQHDPYTLESITKNMLYDRQAQLELLKSGKPIGPRTYEVSINADPAHLLDWDKALSGQSEAVRRAVIDAAKARPTNGPLSRAINQDLQAGNLALTGEQAYSGIGGLGGNRKVATQALSERGIPGIKYLDEGSRTLFARANNPRNANWMADDAAWRKHTPTSNYVIFDTDRIRIDKKYAFPLAAGAGGMGALAAQDRYQPEERL